MMTSLHATNIWDWLSTALMMVGFATLLGLAACLMIALVSNEGGRAPEDDLDRLTTPTDEVFGDTVWPLAS